MKNVADAVASGLMSESLIAKLNELEGKKAELEKKLAEGSERREYSKIDTGLILSGYAEVKEAKASPLYPTFISEFIERIKVGKYTVIITLKTGLGMVSGT